MEGPGRSLADLAAAEREAPPDLAAEARVWADVERRLVHGPPPPDLPPGAGGSLPLLTKVIGGLALVGVIGGAALVGPGLVGDAPAPVDAPALARPGALEPVPEDLSRAPWPKAQVPDAPIVRPPSKAAPVDRPVVRPREAPDAPASEPLDLAAELRLIASIRGALQRGDADLALARIAEHREKFGEDAALAQERGAHEVEAVCAAGRAADARRLAAAFFKKWPDSPHRARVAASCGEQK